MACGYAKYTGRLGVCLATSGPGGIHLLNGLYDAKLDGQPVLAITGHHFHDLIDTHAPAGRRPGQAVHGRGRVQHARHGRGPRRERRRRRLPHRAGPPRRRPHHLPGRLPGRWSDRSERQPSKAQRPHHAQRPGRRRAHARRGRALRAAATCSTPARRSAILAGRGAWRARRRARAARRALGGADHQGAARQGGASPTTARSRPAASACWAPRPSQDAIESCDTLLIVGVVVPLHRVPAQAGPGPRRCRSTSTRPASACATRSRSAWSATAAHPAALLPLLKRKSDRSLPGEGPGGHEASGTS